MTGPIILLTCYASVCLCPTHADTHWHGKGVRDPCCLHYLTRRLINIEMTSGKEVQRFTSGLRQEGGREDGGEVTAQEERREEEEERKTVAEG